MSLTRGIRLSRQKDVDMTTGNAILHIIQFALPLLLGNLFQQLYNTVDTWVVGNHVSTDAFSAVGSVTPITNMLIGSFTGLASGAGVVISQNYGAGRMDKVEESVHTAITMTLILTVVFTLVGLLIAPYLIGFTKLQDKAAQEATTYLTIYIAGIAGLMLYNMGAGILRAIGDSKRPFYYLVVCALLNTALDLFFVLKHQMGVRGVALATVLSQAVSAILVIITLLRTNSCVKLKIRKLRISMPLLKKILIVGIPAALQMAVTAFSNVFVQSYINHFDAGLESPDYMAGWTAYLKIDQLLFLPMQSIALAVTTFVGQNLGKGQIERAKKGVTQAVIISMIATAILMIPLLIFAPSVVGFLNKSENVIKYGSMFLYWLTPFYLVCGFNQIYAGALRGAGDSKACMFIMLGSFVAFRQVYLFCMARICNQIIPIALSYPAGWIVCSVITIIYYHKAKFGKTKLVEDA